MNSVTPSWDQIAGVLRQLIPFVGGFAVAQGWLNVEQITSLTGAIITLGGIAWSLKSNSKASIVTSAANMPEVSGIVTKRTQEGNDLAKATPVNVATAGSAAAEKIARL